MGEKSIPLYCGLSIHACSEIHVSDNIMKARKGFVPSRWQKAVERQWKKGRKGHEKCQLIYVIESMGKDGYQGS